MMTLTKVKVTKYKSIQKPQQINIDPAITTIVGMNESGKTSFLTAIAKTNYFNSNDVDFKFDMVSDYPRNELIDFQDAEDDCDIINCHYAIAPKLTKLIDQDVGEGVLITREFSRTHYYKNKTQSISGIAANVGKFIEFKLKDYTLSKETKKKISKIVDIKEISQVEAMEGDEGLPGLKKEIAQIIQAGNPNWENALEAYIVSKWIVPNIPKFWYFDDYYPLPGKININKMQGEPKSERDKTSRALFELAKIRPADILNAVEKDYEKYVALLEASANKITNEIFKYWSTNKNLDIEFKIQDITNDQGAREKYLDIRVKSRRHKITLPLDRRSKGFNWFFSFIVWFSKIQADKNSGYILLLDEPGLNLHASAQADLLQFFRDLSGKYQIIFTTHSPFMVESDRLASVRTCLETEAGTIISETIQEKDPNTLFPLQAALGYDIAQNLFISKNNLLVEGPADLIYLTAISNLLEIEGRSFLKDNITIVPVGGLDKVSTFISLLRGSKLNVACLLDTYTDQSGKQRVDDLVRMKIIKDKNIRFFDEFANNGKAVADIEDLFSKDDYLKIFNDSFQGEIPPVDVSTLDPSLPTIVKQINKVISKERFNHYRPANKLNQVGLRKGDLSGLTMDNFEKMFLEINKIFA